MGPILLKNMLYSLLRLLRNWTLPLAMLVGIIGHPIFIHFSFITPYLFFAMLMMAFCRVPINQIRFRPLHFWLLLVQIAGGLLAYAILAPWNIYAAEGALVCVITPTGTPTPIITDRLGGNAASVTSYTVISNLGTAIAVPLLFPLLHPLPTADGFWTAFFLILQKVFPLLIGPFVAAVCLRRYLPKLHQKILSYTQAPFYMWAIAMVIVLAQPVKSIVDNHDDAVTQIWVALAALAVCCIQFLIGKMIGGFYHARITGGQSLGQKSTILAIWMAHTYMSPLSAIAGGSYIIWQNIINSWQLWKNRKGIEEGKIDPNQHEP